MSLLKEEELIVYPTNSPALRNLSRLWWRNETHVETTPSFGTVQSLIGHLLSSTDSDPSSSPHPHHYHRLPRPPIYSVVLTEIHLFYPPFIEGQGFRDSYLALAGRGGAWIKALTRTSKLMARLKFTSPGELVLTGVLRLREFLLSLW